MGQHKKKPSRKEVDEFLVQMELANNRLLREMHYMLRALTGIFRPAELHIEFEGATMPVTLQVGQAVVATPVETDAAGNRIPITGDLSWAESGTAGLIGTANADGTFSYQATSAGVSTITVTDVTNNLVGTDTLTVEGTEPPPPPVATALSIEWGVPA